MPHQPGYHNRYQENEERSKDLLLVMNLQVTTLDPTIEVLDSTIQFSS